MPANRARGSAATEQIRDKVLEKVKIVEGNRNIALTLLARHGILSLGKIQRTDTRLYFSFAFYIQSRKKVTLNYSIVFQCKSRAFRALGFVFRFGKGI